MPTGSSSEDELNCLDPVEDNEEEDKRYVLELPMETLATIQAARGCIPPLKFEVTAPHNVTLPPKQVSVLKLPAVWRVPQTLCIQFTTRPGLVHKGIWVISTVRESQEKIRLLLYNDTDESFMIRKDQRIAEGRILGHDEKIKLNKVSLK